MLDAILDAFERRCASEAPTLLGDLRALRVHLDRSTTASTLFDDFVTSDEPQPSRLASTPGGRYVDLGSIGVGGMGEVRRVYDRELNRTLAMKSMLPGLDDSPTSVARFVEEAQATAQLQHPSIVPVHELGTLEDGRVYFTMKEVRGRTLSEVITEVCDPGKPLGEPSASGWTFRRLVSALHQASQAVAYAHERGVVHRDLKPDNIMVGDHGEVQVMDWGLAKVAGNVDLPAVHGDSDVVVTDRSRDDAARTRAGTVAGTPAYMAPEQARGDLDRIDARTDVYALGAVLYEVLSGRPPYDGPHGEAVWRQALQGPPPPPQRRGAGSSETLVLPAPENLEEELPAGGLPPGATLDTPLPPEQRADELPEELVEICARAMRRQPEHRYPSASAFAVELGAWLDGSKRRAQALAIVEQADAIAERAAHLPERARALRLAADALLTGVPTWAPEEAKAAAWSKQAEAEALERRATLATIERQQLLAGALTHAPDLAEAHALLAEDYRLRHVVAETARDHDAVARAEVLMRSHAEALPEAHPVRRHCAHYLSGIGALTLVTDPPGAEVQLQSYETRNRRLVAVRSRSLGVTPLRAVSLRMGSYLCVLRHPDMAAARYPVHIGRGEHWDGVRPGDTDPHPIRLLRMDKVELGDCPVPAGWFWSMGGQADGSLPRRRLWCDGLVAKRFPVTNREYITFLDHLVAEGRDGEALRYAPRERAGKEGEQGALIYGRDATGQFHLVADADGDVWLPDWPVIQVDWYGAMAYAAWETARTGVRWRLPGELEWERAARGADGRFYPFGDYLDPSWCAMTHSYSGRRLPVVVDSFPLDASPYGVRGLAGNVRDWCADLYSRSGPATASDVVLPPSPPPEADTRARALRGGSWRDAAQYSRCAYRFGAQPFERRSNQGFRLVRSTRHAE